MKIVALVPARSGSKGVPDKNIKPFCGKPLMAYSIEAARDCPEIDAVYVSSDSQRYLDIAKSFGAKTLLRDAKLANDESAIHPVMTDFIARLEADGMHYDAVVLLYPIYPIRFAKDLSEIVRTFLARGGRGSMLGAKEPDTHPYLCLQAQDDGTIDGFINKEMDVCFRRQMYPRYFELTHWAYICATDELPKLNNQLVNESTTAYFVPKTIPVVDIDTPLDFEFGEFLLEKLKRGEGIPGQV